MKGITPFLWFDHQAEEAARFYTSVFKHSKLGNITHYGASGAQASGRAKGSVMTVEFELDDRKFVALNGGPQFPFTEAVSFAVECKNQEEIDYYWGRLSEGGTPSVCGWLKDKYGLSWQIVPAELDELLNEDDPARADRVMAAVISMRKLDLAALREAYEGVPAEVGR
jgi:predicted 3-demethylubiquinone-9 3-methyltransferase (glyoxalase superfamily)